jgi:subfamily B ATP-binding cassette protein MsbA
MISKFLRCHLGSVLGAMFLALLLGAITATLGILLGPAVQLLIDDQMHDNTVKLTTFFGGPLSAAMIYLGISAEVSYHDFFGLLPWLLILLATLKMLAGSLQWFLWERLGELWSREARRDAMSSFLNIPAEAMVVNPLLGDQIASMLTTDIRYVREYIVRFYGGLPREGLQIIFIVIFLILLSPKLFFIFVLGIAPVMVVIAALGKRLRRRSKAVMANYQVLAEWIQQRLLGVETIKHYRTESFEVEKMRLFNRGLHRSLLRSETIKAMSGPLVELFAIIAVSVVLYIALNQVLEGEIAGVVQLSFFGNLVLLSQAGGKLGKYFNSNREAGAAIERISNGMKEYRALFQGDLNKVAERPELSSVQLKCEHLAYRYPSADGFAVRGINWEFDAGKFYVITGPSGSGKSTLIRLLLGVLAPTEGSVLRGAKASVGYMSQRQNLMIGTVAENILYPRNGPGDIGRMKQIFTQLKLDSLALPEGLETMVGDGYRRFSGGQEQRIAMARMMYHQDKIYIMDEGTSALDPESEDIIFRLLKDHCHRGGTVIMISHRSASVRYADVVYQLSTDP